MSSGSCPQCGHEITIEDVAGRNELLFVLYINWDATHQSPPIGPFNSVDANRAEKEIRSKMRAAGYRHHGKRMVERRVIKPGESWKSWFLSKAPKKESK